MYKGMIATAAVVGLLAAGSASARMVGPHDVFASFAECMAAGEDADRFGQWSYACEPVEDGYVLVWTNAKKGGR